jgi:hypothetical protein
VVQSALLTSAESRSYYANTLQLHAVLCGSYSQSILMWRHAKRYSVFGSVIQSEFLNLTVPSRMRAVHCLNAMTESVTVAYMWWFINRPYLQFVTFRHFHKAAATTTPLFLAIVFFMRNKEPKSKSKLRYDWQPVSMSWCRAPLVIMTRCLLLFDVYCRVFVRRPLWGEIGSVVCQSESALFSRLSVHI